MKKLGILLVIIALAKISFGQMKQREIDAITNDTTLFYGLGNVCNSYESAMESAVEKLFGNIAKNCSPNAIYIAGNGDNQVETIVKTFKESLGEKALEKAVKEDYNREEYQYLVFIKRSDFRDMCNERRDDIQRYISKAIKMENDACYEDALKAYYWALMLTYAHPQGKKLRFHGENGTVDYEWIVDKINGADGILKSFTFIVPKDGGIEENDDCYLIKLKVQNKEGKDVSSLSCSYHDGRKFVPNTVRDGKLIVKLYDKSKKELHLKVNYDFVDDAKKVKVEVANAIQLIPVPRFSNNGYKIDLEKTMKVETKTETPSWAKVERNRSVDKDDYLGKMMLIEKAIRDRDIYKARECFSREGFNMLDTLSRYGRMTVVGKQEYRFLRYKDEVICRSITIQFDFRNTPGFSQDVVFRFDTINKVVTSLAFRLSDQAEYEIMSKAKWPEESRLILVNFLEDYQTAYALKRHRYLQSIYSDDALIIVGRVLEKTEIPDRMTLKLSAEDVKLTQYDKTQYMEKLMDCFHKNEYIRLRFTETDFTKAKATSAKDVYGVRVRQEYFSSTYGDVGYLFLLVDLRGKNPLIHVRAWQPDKVDLEKLMNMSDVRFN